MTRSSFRPMASVGLVAAVLTYVGCTKTHETADKPTEGRVEIDGDTEHQARPAEVDPAKAEQGPKIMADWSARPPVAILMISGEQDGYPDPCGCTAGQLGGLGRRYHFCEMLESKGWPVVKIDLGNLIHLRGDSPGGPAQEKIKFNIIHKALEAMKYDAVALGPEDLKPGISDTLVALLNFKEPKFMAANVSAVDKQLGEAIRPTRIVKAGGLTFGITAVLDPATFKTLQDADAEMLTVKAPDEVLAGVYADLRREAQVTVLMVQGPPEEAKRLAEKFRGFDIVIGTSKFEDPDEHPKPLDGGQRLLIDNIGKKGKYVGVVGFYPNAEHRMEFRRVALDKDFTPAKEMKVLIDKEYQDMLRVEGVVENITRLANGQAPGASYVGAQACQACHPKTFEKWQSTKHAKAYEPLTNPKRNREFDAECISCHTTGFGYNTGWVSAEKTPLLKGNQCENCHGPASLHAADTDNIDFRKPMAMTAESANRNNFCIQCHDEDNDHNFVFAPRYAQIFHNGLDTYDDPKVHQPQPAKVADGVK